MENRSMGCRLWILGVRRHGGGLQFGFWTKKMDTSIQVRGKDGKLATINVGPEADFERFKVEHNELVQQHPDYFGPLKVNGERKVIINGLPFKRIDYSAEEAVDDEKVNNTTPKKQLVSGFRLRGENIWVEVTMLEPKQLSVCEKIVQSLRR